MADFTADFEAGTNGNNVTTGAGEASATAWDLTPGAAKYDNAHVAHGSLAMKCSAINDFGQWTASGTDYYGRMYLYFTSWPAADLTGPFTTDQSVGKLLNDGRFMIQDSTGTTIFTTPIATNQWVRIEFHMVHSATVGQVEIKLFNDANSATPTETQTSPANHNVPNETLVRFGWTNFGAGSSPFWMDDIVANATSYPGPVVTSASYTILNGSDEQLSNVNVGGTDVDPASYKDGVVLTETELATLLDGTSFGKKNVAVLPNLTGVADARQIKKTTFSAETESA